MILAAAMLCAGTFLLMYLLTEWADRWFKKNFHENSLEKKSQPNEDDPEFLEFVADKVRQDHYDADD